MGYYFSKPIVAEAMTVLLKKGSIPLVRHAVMLEAVAS